jgi:hypothetical protein
MATTSPTSQSGGRGRGATFGGAAVAVVFGGSATTGLLFSGATFDSGAAFDTAEAALADPVFFAATATPLADTGGFTVDLAATGFLAAAATGRAMAVGFGSVVSPWAVRGFGCGAPCLRSLPAGFSTVGRVEAPLPDLPLLALIYFIPCEKVPPFGPVAKITGAARNEQALGKPTQEEHPRIDTEKNTAQTQSRRPSHPGR